MKKTFGISSALIAIMGLSWALLGSGVGAQAAKNEGPAAPQVGETCTIYLRGDATGSGFHDRLPDLNNLIRRSGTIVAADGQWVVIKEGDKRLRIPHSSIAVIETAPAAKPAP